MLRSLQRRSNVLRSSARYSAVRACLALCVGLLAACGDVDYLIVVSFGTVEANAFCSPTGGSFRMRDQEGLTVAVILTDDTQIFASGGGSGRCSDITAGSLAEVRGNENDGVIEADSVRLGAG